VEFAVSSGPCLATSLLNVSFARFIFSHASHRTFAPDGGVAGC
jgi:hypothetical protein